MLWESFQSAFGILAQPLMLPLIVVSNFVGIVLGALPGIGPLIGIVILIPFVMNLSPQIGLISLIAIYVGGNYGGGISSAVLGIPGTPMAAATLLDARPMVEKGQGGKAIGLITSGSVFGGLFSALALTFISPALARVALLFGPPEYTVLTLLGLATIATLTRGSTVKGMLSALIGLLVAIVGTDVATASFRFTFGIPGLEAGIGIVPMLMGVFAVSRVLEMLEEEGIKIKEYSQKELRPEYPGPKTLWRLKSVFLRGSIIGTLIGALPGAGATIAAYISYSEAKRTSKHPEQFGSGSEEGVVAPEAANNAVTGGAMIPMLTLGIPGDPVTAVLMGLLFIQGLTPGPNLFRYHGDLVYAIFLAMIVTNIVMYFLAFYTNRAIMKLLAGTRHAVLVPLLLLIAVLGSYSVTASIFDVIILCAFGLFGYLLRKLKVPLPPIVLGFVLGPILEQNLRRAMAMSAGDPSIFVTRPLSIALIVFLLLMILWPKIADFRRRGASGNE